MIKIDLEVRKSTGKYDNDVDSDFESDSDSGSEGDNTIVSNEVESFKVALTASFRSPLVLQSVSSKNKIVDISKYMQDIRLDWRAQKSDAVVCGFFVAPVLRCAFSILTFFGRAVAMQRVKVDSIVDNKST